VEKLKEAKKLKEAERSKEAKKAEKGVGEKKVVAEGDADVTSGWPPFGASLAGWVWLYLVAG